jgi:hypothetical protein
MLNAPGQAERSLATGRVPDAEDRQGLCAALAVLCAFLLLSLSQTTAAAPDPANISGSIFFNVPPPARLDFNTFQTFSQTGPGGFLQFTASGIPGPFLSGEAKISKNFTGHVSGILVYGIEVVGPAGDVAVSVDVSGGASASSVANDPFAAFAMKSLWSLEGPNLGPQGIFSEGIDTGQLSGIFNQSFGHTLDFTLSANHVYKVTMIADAFAAAGSSGTLAFATAFIDPIFSFGPGVGPEYSFLLSDGIGNSAPVPEPASVVLLVVGTLAFGFVRIGGQLQRFAASSRLQRRIHPTLSLRRC